MTFSRKSILCAFITITMAVASHGAPPAAPDAKLLVGLWEMQSGKDLKSGQEFASKDALWWFQFSRSHWMAMQMARERKAPLPESEFAKLSSDEKVKANHARVWNENGQQLFAARAGTYSLEGDKLHQRAAIALYSEIIGVDRVLRIVRMDKNTLVVRTEFADQPDVQQEWTFHRIE
jgi:hypothetical protein